MTEERRRDPRCTLRLNVSYAIQGTKKIGKALTTDISAGGARFVAEHRLEVGDRLELVLRLPERDEPVRCLADVRWTKPVQSTDKALQSSGAEIGVQFVELAPKDRALLAQYASFYGPPRPS